MISVSIVINGVGCRADLETANATEAAYIVMIYAGGVLVEQCYWDRIAGRLVHASAVSEECYMRLEKELMLAFWRGCA